MANVLEYTLSLNDKVSDKLTQIGIANDKQLATWAAVQQKVVNAEKTLTDCGVSIGSLRERIEALKAERDWIPADNIEAIKRNNQAIQEATDKIRGLENIGVNDSLVAFEEAAPSISKIEVNILQLTNSLNAVQACINNTTQEWVEYAEVDKVDEEDIENVEEAKEKLDSLADAMESANNVGSGGIKSWLGNIKSMKIVNPINLVGKAIGKLSPYMKAASAAYDKQSQAETGLAAAMRLHTGASDEEIESIKQLTSAQQSLGVISDRVQMSGAQQLASFVNNKGSIETLIPAMNNLLAQQKGLNATESDAANIGNLMGEAMKGNTSALTNMGIKLSSAQERILKYGDEAQRVATLAQAITDNVGEANQALAATPEGGLKQHANTMEDLQERIGNFYKSIQSSLLPVFNVISGALDDIVSWFEQNKETVTSTISAIAVVFEKVFSIVGDVVVGAIDFFGGWIAKLREGNTPLTILSIALGSLATAVTLIATAKSIWTAVQKGLNLSLLACPLTWIVASGIFLIGVITYLCYKINGWGSLWDGIVGFMKYSFMAYVDTVKLYFDTLVNGIMIGIDKIKLGWYKAKEAFGLGDSSENQEAIKQITADMEERQKAISDGADKVKENLLKAKESLAGIDMSWNSEKSLSDITDGLKEKLGMGGASSAPGTKDTVDTDDLTQDTTGLLPEKDNGNNNGSALSPGTGNGNNSAGAGAGTSSAISTGGSRSSSVTINLKSLVETLSFGSYEGDRDTMQRDLESRLIRVLEMANSAM